MTNMLKLKKKKQKTVDSKVLLILGAGNMGQALARGLLALNDNTAAVDEINVFDIHHSKSMDLTEDLQTKKTVKSKKKIVAITSDKELEDSLQRAGILAICTKPQDIPIVVKQCQGLIPRETLVISVAAGVSMEQLSTRLKHSGPIVRAMPNIAAKVGAAATAMAPNNKCGPSDRDLANRIFSAIGDALWIREDLLHAVTGLSGSGPAYIFMVIEALTEGGVKMGIPRDVSRQLATQTVFGSAALLKSTGLHPANLREQVTTPGGTTVNAIHELEERGLRAMLMSAVATATKRSEELDVLTLK